MNATPQHAGTNGGGTAIDPAAIYFVGMGAQTPIGRSALASAAAVRCAISAYAEHPYMIDKHGEPMIVCRADWLDEDLTWPERLATLAGEAARQAWGPIETNPAGRQLACCVHLAVGDPPPGRPRADEAVVARVRRALGLTDKDPVRIHAGGHAAGFAALDAACAQFAAGRIRLALVGGVDSYIDPEYLEAIDSQGRLHSVNYSWGITPGEGAGCVLLADGAAANTLGMVPLAQLVGVGTAQETKTMGTKTVCIGEGLTAAYKQAMGALAGSANGKSANGKSGSASFGKIQHSYCDMNGETYRADEFGFAVLRTRQYYEDAGSFTTPADCWGDVGAASAPLLLTLPLCAWARGYGKGETKLVWCSSAGQAGRGAAVIGHAGGSIGLIQMRERGAA